MNKLEADLKNGIYKNLYVLYGPQAYLKNIYRDRLVKTFLRDGDTINYAHYSGNTLPVGEIIDLAETMPFMADKRVIVLEDTGVFNKSSDDFADYFENIPDSTVFIFSEDKVNGTIKATKTAKNVGCLALFGDLTPQDMEKWVKGRLTKEKKQITGRALSMFLSSCGHDMLFVSSELEKLISYTKDKDGIYPEDVEAICTFPIEDKIFAMLDAVFEHRLGEAMRMYATLVKNQTEPLAILANIRNNLLMFLRIKKMKAEGLNINEMVEALQLPPKRAFLVKKSLPLVQKSSKIWFMESLDACADTEYSIKNGLIDQKIGIESLIIRLST